MPDAGVFNTVYDKVAFGSVGHYLCPGLATGMGVVLSPALPMLPSDDRLRK